MPILDVLSQDHRLRWDASCLLLATIMVPDDSELRGQYTAQLRVEKAKGLPEGQTLLTKRHHVLAGKFRGRKRIDQTMLTRRVHSAIAGTMLWKLHTAATTYPDLASKRKIEFTIDRISTEKGKLGSLATLRDAWRQFRPVIHWCAAMVYQGRVFGSPFPQQPESGYLGDVVISDFLALGDVFLAFAKEYVDFPQDEFGANPPYGVGPDALLIAYYASAEIGCHLSLGWPVPERILDLFTEFRNSLNGLPPSSGFGLIGALVYHGLDWIGAGEKQEMRELALRGGPWTPAERQALLDYCESDVIALARLLPAMIAKIDLPRAIYRGRYMAAAARIERAGVPIDTTTLERLKLHWFDIQDQLIADIDADYSVFDGRSFKTDRFAAWLSRTNVPWPRLERQLDLSDDVFREMARAHPSVAAPRELRLTLSKMRLNDLAVGHDGRNRTILSAFRSRTGRNQPSNAKSIFGPSVWLRGLIQPSPGYGVAYIDWSQQEFGIAAALSRDPRMMDAYLSGDPYLAFAMQAGAVPPEATKQSHKAERDQFKACVLAVQYGMGSESLALRIGQPPIRARELLRLHRETYRIFWRWSDQMLDYAMLNGHLYTVFGWRVLVPPDANERSLRNFPMQANGAEMLRLACCLATEQGIEVCVPVHDAVLIAAPLERIETEVARMKQAMREASRLVLDGFELGADATIVSYPDRYMDDRGAVMWNKVTALLDQAEASEPLST